MGKAGEGVLTALGWDRYPWKADKDDDNLPVKLIKDDKSPCVK